MCAPALLTLAAASPASGPRDWPPFLRASDQYPAQIASSVRRLWTDPTFIRTVNGDPAPVPLAFYLRFVDAPDVTAAAARHLRLTTYEVTAVGDGRYQVVNGSSTRGVYNVLARDGGTRVLLSWGTHRGSILGTIGGSALTRLEFAAEGGRATQQLATNVIIDDGFAAGMARPFFLLFGWLVDRKLNEAFLTAASAAGWAHANPDEFCTWLRGAVTDARRDEVLGVFKECVKG